MIAQWNSLSPEERGAICERVHRQLMRRGGQSATGLMHGCAMSLDYISCALVDMEQRGAVRRDENSAGVEIWTVVHKNALTQAR